MVITDVFDCPENPYDDNHYAPNLFQYQNHMKLLFMITLNIDPIADIRVSENELGDIPINGTENYFELTIVTMLIQIHLI